MSLNFNGISKTLTPIDVDGVPMYNLNWLHKEWGLPESRVPSEWRDALKEALSNSANLRSKAGRYGGTVATQMAVYAYASWVSPEFYMAVLKSLFSYYYPGETKPKHNAFTQNQLVTMGVRHTSSRGEWEFSRAALLSQYDVIKDTLADIRGMGCAPKPEA